MTIDTGETSDTWDAGEAGDAGVRFSAGGQRQQRVGAWAPVAPAASELRLEAGLGFRLARLTRIMRAAWAAELAEHALTPPQAAVLRAVADQPGCSLRALARLLGTEPMRAKRCVDDLEERQLLVSDHDGGARRSRALRLTPEGARLAATVTGLVRHQDARVEEVLGASRRRALEAALTALEDHLDLPPAPVPSPERATATPTPRPTPPGAATATPTPRPTPPRAATAASTDDKKEAL